MTSSTIQTTLTPEEALVQIAVLCVLSVELDNSEIFSICCNTLALDPDTLQQKIFKQIDLKRKEKYEKDTH